MKIYFQLFVFFLELFFVKKNYFWIGPIPACVKNPKLENHPAAAGAMIKLGEFCTASSAMPAAAAGMMVSSQQQQQCQFSASSV